MNHTFKDQAPTASTQATAKCLILLVVALALGMATQVGMGAQPIASVASSETASGSDATTDGDTTDGETTEAETTDTETTDGETTDGETTDGESTDAETTDGESTDTETTNAESTDANTTDTESTDGASTDAETTDAETSNADLTSTSGVETADPDRTSDATAASSTSGTTDTNTDAAATRTFLSTDAQFLAAHPVDLGTADSFAVLGGSTVTNIGPSVISGDLGVFPGCAVTGFPPGTVINGTIHQCNAVAQQAKAALVTAYNDAAGRTPTARLATELGGRTLTAGVYDSASGTFGITGILTLDAQGNPDAVFIFQTASTLITASFSQVRLINGAQACNVFWQVGSSATLGTDSSFAGNILALTSITANTGATVQGRLLARNGAVTLDTNTVTRAQCAPPGVLPPGVVPPDAVSPDADSPDAVSPDADSPDARRPGARRPGTRGPGTRRPVALRDGALPGAALPAGALPPGALPPGALPPGVAATAVRDVLPLTGLSAPHTPPLVGMALLLLGAGLMRVARPKRSS